MIKQATYLAILITIIGMIVSCATKTAIKGNPPADGFNMAASDQKAIAIADMTMEAMGGRAAYENTRYLSWNFFGSRKHVWDKHTGDVYIKSLKDDYELNMNINNMKGSLTMSGTVISHPDSLSKYLQKGKEMWINDSYWLVMPYKLKDSGVTLKYIGVGETTAGAAADKLELTFEQVGVTPQNKYHVYVDQSSRLITQWDFFTNADDKEPRFSTPWNDYKMYGSIMLSGDRGRNSLTEIQVSDALKTYFE